PADPGAGPGAAVQQLPVVPSTGIPAGLAAPSGPRAGRPFRGFLRDPGGVAARGRAPPGRDVHVVPRRRVDRPRPAHRDGADRVEGRRAAGLLPHPSGVGRMEEPPVGRPAPRGLRRGVARPIPVLLRAGRNEPRPGAPAGGPAGRGCPGGFDRASPGNSRTRFRGTPPIPSASKGQCEEIAMKTILATVMSLLVAGSVYAQNDGPERGKVDVVFCVDRSGSMDRVIETAKRKIWTIVNEVAQQKPTPILRIGLIGYGSADKDIKFFPLSTDLDKVYENLTTFRCDMGGDEWVGWALQQAAERMEWASERKALKMIFMVGNETAAQGREDVMYTKTAPLAIKKDISVNVIYCGKPNPEEERTWREVASLADGFYS